MPRAESDGERRFESRFRVRSYELDGFGHLNHAVYFNYFEQARFEALAAGGLDLEKMSAGGWGVHLVHAEADFSREALLGTEMVVTTRVSGARSSSMTVEHVAHEPGRPGMVFARGEVVAVWVGPDRRPMRIPEEVRRALGISD